jgi:hypothetical protein
LLGVLSTATSSKEDTTSVMGSVVATVIVMKRLAITEVQWSSIAAVIVMALIPLVVSSNNEWHK